MSLGRWRRPLRAVFGGIGVRRGTVEAVVEVEGVLARGPFARGISGWLYTSGSGRLLGATECWCEVPSWSGSGARPAGSSRGSSASWPSRNRALDAVGRAGSGRCAGGKARSRADEVTSCDAGVGGTWRRLQVVCGCWGSWCSGRCKRCRYGSGRCTRAESGPEWSGNGSRNHSDCWCKDYLKEIQTRWSVIIILQIISVLFTNIYTSLIKIN